MRQDEMQSKAREELSALKIIGIDPGSLRRKKTESPPESAVVESTTVKTTTVESTTVKVDIRNNYFKCDNDVSDILAPTQTLAEQAVYRRLYRLSFGFKQNTCRVGMGRLAKSCNIGSSNKTVKAAINGLKEKGHIAIVDEAKNNKAGTQYRVFLPCEIPGIESPTIVKSTVVENTVVDPTVVNSADPAMVENTVVKNTTEAPTIDTTGSKSTVVNSTVVDSTPIKERHSIKDSLSPDPVKLFYIGIGQKRISKIKRERGNKVVQELKADGFSLEDIAYAAEWTPKNAKEEVYDMAILKHTIGEAVSTREAGQQATDREREEAAGFRAAEEERRRLQGEILKIREGMTKKGLAELREKALEKLRKTPGYNESFLNEPTITAKENEILHKS